MGTVFTFMVGTIGLSKKGGHKPSTLMHAARHNKREIQAESGAGGHIDPSRSALNEVLAGPATADAVVALGKTLMERSGVDSARLRRDHVQAVEIIFGLPVGTTIDDGLYFRRSVEWVGDRFGNSNILSADIHRDEGAPHCHVLALPIVKNKMAGGIDKATLKSLRELFYQAVARRFGLSKPPTRLVGSARRAGVNAVMEVIKTTQDASLQSAVWQVVRASIERDPGPYMAVLGLAAAPAASKPSRTMGQIFTSPGKGSKTEPVQKPIAFPAAREKPIAFQNDRKLCTVAFARPNCSPTGRWASQEPMPMWA
jgi:hypothetical protein